MAISKEEIIHIGKLADINLSDEEVERYAKDCSEILEYANMINLLDTDGVKETIASNDSFNVFRKDEIKPCMDRDVLLRNAPSQDDGMFQIPKVIN